MNQRAILNLLEPHFPALIEDQLQAYRDFDKTHNDNLRVTVEGSRPKWVNLRTVHLLEMRFGTSGPVRVMSEGGLKYLFFEGKDFNVGLRAKKLSKKWLSYQHPSHQQDELRRSGRFAWHEDTHHLLLGFRDSGGLQPHITNIAITSEIRSRVLVVANLWSSAQGVISLQTVQETFDLPSIARYRPKSIKEDRANKKRG